MRRLAGAACLALPALLLAAPAHALEAVRLQLKWTHAFQFAGYYAAKELGYYREAGLDVEIVPAGPGVDPLKAVLDGRAQYGVGNSSLLLARKAGHPVVALAVIFQHSPLVLIARQQHTLQSVHDLIGKRVMMEPQADELLAYLLREDLPVERVTQLAHSYSPQDLIDGKVDAISAYVTNEPYYLDRAGLPYHVYTPRAAGIDFYGDNLFTTEQEIAAHPQRVKAFRAASLRGWQYAMAHPGKITELILQNYSHQHGSAFYQYEARRMLPLLRPDLIEIGYMHPDRWRHIADTYADLGLLPPDFSLRGFLYQPDAAPDLSWLYAALALLGAISALALYIHRINRRLARSLAHSKRAEQDLRLSEQRHRLLADHASDLIWTMDLAGRLTYVSPSVQKLRGYSSAEGMRQTLNDMLTPASAAVAEAGLGRMIRAIRAGLPVPEFRAELEYPCKDGTTVWTEASVTGLRDDAGAFVGLLGVTRDISERRRNEERIRHLAQHDLLTDLPNRALFGERLQAGLAKARRDGSRLALLFLDLDQFKPVNDTLGHRGGDLLLQEVALRLRACLRPGDTAARLGGDEFALLLPLAGQTQDALAAAAGICASLRQPCLIGGHTVTVSSSIGVALYPEHGSDEATLTRHADSAMYAAKKAGRNNVKLYRPPAFKPRPRPACMLDRQES